MSVSACLVGAETLGVCRVEGGVISANRIKVFEHQSCAFLLYTVPVVYVGN